MCLTHTKTTQYKQLTAKNWEKLLEKDINWKEVCIKTNNIKETKLKWFQIRINNRILVNNSILMSMGITATNVCNFCNQEKDTLLHYLWNCVHVKHFWTDFENMLKNYCTHCDRLTLSPSLALLGKDNNLRTDKPFDFILLHAKYFIYKCRLNKTRPRIEMFKTDLQFLYNVDKHVHTIEMSMDKFYRKWLPYRNILE